MTDINVVTTPYQVEKRSWLITEPGSVGFGYTPSCTLDVSAFTAATHYPKGYFPSGLALGIITAASDASKTIVGPYDDTASDGRQTCVGLLFASVKVPDLTDLTKDVGAAMVTDFAVVKISKMPVLAAGTPTGRGYIDANGQADLPRIRFVA